MPKIQPTILKLKIDFMAKLDFEFQFIPDIMKIKLTVQTLGHNVWS